jgi:hypothetical protein
MEPVIFFAHYLPDDILKFLDLREIETVKESFIEVEKINRQELFKTIEIMRKKVYTMRAKEKENQKENV